MYVCNNQYLYRIPVPPEQNKSLFLRSWPLCFALLITFIKSSSWTPSVVSWLGRQHKDLFVQHHWIYMMLEVAKFFIQFYISLFPFVNFLCFCFNSSEALCRLLYKRHHFWTLVFLLYSSDTACVSFPVLVCICTKKNNHPYASLFLSHMIHSSPASSACLRLGKQEPKKGLSHTWHQTFGTPFPGRFICLPLSLYFINKRRLFCFAWHYS